jgi:WD40 repeat protein
MRRMWLAAFVAGGLVVAASGQPTDLNPLRTFVLEQGRPGPQVQFSPDGKRVSVLTPTAVVTSPLVVGGTAKSLTVKKGQGTAFMVRPDGLVVVTQQAPNQVTLIDPAKAKVPAKVVSIAVSPNTLTPSPDGKLFALTLLGANPMFGLDERSISVWDAATLKELYALQRVGNRPRQVAFAPDGKVVAVYDTSAVVRLFDTANGKLVATLDPDPLPKGVGPGVSSFAFSPDSTRLYVPTPDQTAIGVWDLAERKRVGTLPPPGGSLQYSYLAAHPDGKTLAAVASEGMKHSIVRLDASTGMKVAEYAPKTAAGLQELAYSPDGKWLAVTASYGKQVDIYEAK